MRYKFGRWNIEICKVQMHLSFEELYLLEYLEDFYNDKSDKSKVKYEDEKKYMWFNYDSILEGSRLFIVNEKSDLKDGNKKSLTRESQLNALGDMMRKLERKGIIQRREEKIKKDRNLKSSYGTMMYIYMNKDVLNIMHDQECTSMTEEQHRILLKARALHTPHQNDRVGVHQIHEVDVHQNDAVNTYNTDTLNINTKKKDIYASHSSRDSRTLKNNSSLDNINKYTENFLKDAKKIVRINFSPDDTLRAFIRRCYKKFQFYFSEYDDKEFLLSQHAGYIISKYDQRTIHLAFHQMLIEIEKSELTTINTTYINNRLDIHDCRYEVDYMPVYDYIKKISLNGKSDDTRVPKIIGYEVECPKCGCKHNSKVLHCEDEKCFAQFFYTSSEESAIRTA